MENKRKNPEAQPHPCPNSASAVTDWCGPFCWIKAALLGKSPAPLDILTKALPALDQALMCLFSHRSCGEDKPCCCFCRVVIFKSLTTHWYDMFARACFCSYVSPVDLFPRPPDAAWHLCSPSPSMVNWNTTPASWKICWWTWLMLRPPRTPNWCCAALSLLWRKCWPTGCPSACTATSRWGRERKRLCKVLRQDRFKNNERGSEFVTPPLWRIVQETVGEPFFLLLCAIKQQINKGSIDAITGKARYTLNEEWLLRENVEAKPQVRYLTHTRLMFPMHSFHFYSREKKFKSCTFLQSVKCLTDFLCFCRTWMCPFRAVAWTLCQSGSCIRTQSARWRKKS